MPRKGSSLANNLPKECTRCGEIHRRKHSWCARCVRDYYEGHAPGCVEPGKPPLPPPGFDPLDCQRGRPVL
jgi:ribosomal protein L32